MSEKHTPGPWKICGAAKCPCRLIWSADESHVVAAAHGGHWKESIGDPWPCDERANANAKLIAAAPSMYDALRMLTDAAINLAPYPPEVSVGMVAIIDIARAAIRLAEPASATEGTTTTEPRR